jgi:serine protease Do
MVSQTPKGTTVTVKVLRQKKEIDMPVVVAELPKKLAEAAPDEEAGNEQESTALTGIIVHEITPDIARRFGLDEEAKGVLIIKVDQGSKAFEAGLRPGDIVVQINKKNVATIEDYKKAASRLKGKERILLLIKRKGEDLFVTIKPE